MKTIYRTKFLPVLCGMTVMLALMAGITSISVSAAPNGIYIAVATPHYQHPNTGIIEDAGGDGSAVLGQSMTESAVCRQALVEVDSSGNTYITIRIQLMDNIRNPQFQADGSPVSVSLMQEDYSGNTADYRMQVNSENSVIRCNMFVIAMGRDVVFYITVSNLQSGSGDFITSITVEEPKQPDPVQIQTTSEVQTPEESQSQSEVQEQPSAKTQNPEQSSVEETPVQTLPTENHVPESTVPADSEIKTETTAESAQVKNDAGTTPGLQEFDKKGNKVDDSETKDTQNTDGGRTVIWPALGIIVVAAAVGAIWYFRFFRKKI